MASRRVFVVILSFAVFTAGCSGESEPSASSTSADRVTSSIDSNKPGANSSVTGNDISTSGRTDPRDTSKVYEEASTVEGSTGEMVVNTEDCKRQWPVPPAGSTLNVVAVPDTDNLNFRAEPSLDSNVVAVAGSFGAQPTIKSLGEVCENDGTWWKVEISGLQVWARSNFLGSLGEQSDITSEVGGEGDIVAAESVQVLYENLIDQLMGDDASVSNFVVVNEAPDALGGKATIDILDSGDETQFGSRILFDFHNVFRDARGDYEIINVTETIICRHGATNGRCNEL